MTSARLLIGYGSHTGQAESISKQIAERATAVGLEPVIKTLNDIEKELDLTKESFVVIVVSSTGDGDAPENSARFLRRISRKGLPEDHLKGLQYALLGLGDSNYSTYQGVPIKLDHQLAFLGATRVLERGEADDQVGLELVVEPWLEKLFNEELAVRYNLDSTKLSRAFASKLTLAAAKDEKEKEKIMEEWKATTGNLFAFLAYTLSLAERKINNIVPNRSTAPGSEDSGDGTVPSTTVSVKGTASVAEALPIVDHEYPSGASVRSGAAKLAGDANLRVPVAPQPFIKGTVVSADRFVAPSDFSWQNDAPMPGVVSTRPLPAVVVSHSILTSLDAKKPKRELIFELTDAPLSYEPGDAFYITPENQRGEVDFILDRMGVLEQADSVYEIAVDPNTSKGGAAIPQFCPTRSSLRHLFTYCLDIRRAPGRPLLRVLADAASDAAERRRLLEMCSAQGVSEFTTHVRQAALSLVDILLAFPSARPVPERLIENLPRLMPRPYSMSSCVTSSGRRLRFAYSIRQDAAADGRRYARVGVQTQILCDIRVGHQVKLLEKEPARFRLPPLGCAPEVGLYTPLVMIGPGTGVSTFLSFTQHIRSYLRAHPDDEKCAATRRILFFGCRDATKDYIYQDEINSLVAEGILNTVYVAESTVEGRPKYVQDCVREHADEIMSLIRSTSASPHPTRVYVCGDAKGMSKDLWECFVQTAATTAGTTVDEARKFMMELKKSDRYIEDVWS